MLKRLQNVNGRDCDIDSYLGFESFDTVLGFGRLEFVELIARFDLDNR
jgi:hypothetical protein